MGCMTSLAVAEPGDAEKPGIGGPPLLGSIEERETVVVDSRRFPANITCVPRTRPRAAGFQ